MSFIIKAEPILGPPDVNTQRLRQSTPSFSFPEIPTLQGIGIGGLIIIGIIAFLIFKK